MLVVLVPELPFRLLPPCGPAKAMVKLDRKSTICISCDVVISKLGQNCQKKMRTLSINIIFFTNYRKYAVTRNYKKLPVSAKNRFLHFQGAGRREQGGESREEEAGSRKQGGGRREGGSIRFPIMDVPLQVP